jgi:hypothetical protein
MELDTPLEYQVTNISESIQGFHAKIVKLETHTTPSTPPDKHDNPRKYYEFG